MTLIIRSSVKPKNPEDLATLDDALKTLAKSDSTIQVITEESGIIFIAAADEAHLNKCLADLSSTCQIISSSPMAIYRETIHEQSAITCMSRSPNNLNNLWVIAEPLEPSLVRDLESGEINGDMDPKEISKLLTMMYDWDNVNIWSFGPDTRNGTNILVDRTSDVNPSHLSDAKESIVKSFLSLCQAGVVCGESMTGVLFTIKSIHLDSDGANRGSSEILSASRRAMSGAVLSAGPQPSQPIYKFTIQGPHSVLDGVQKIVAQRKGVVLIVDEENPSNIEISGELPVSNSFGFKSEVDSKGATSFQLVFDHWKTMDDSLETLKEIRRSKGMDPDLPSLELFFDKPLK
eukprot:gene10909-12714_t